MAIASVQVVVCVSTVALCEFFVFFSLSSLSLSLRGKCTELHQQMLIMSSKQISSARRIAHSSLDSTLLKNWSWSEDWRSESEWRESRNAKSGIYIYQQVNHINNNCNRDRHLFLLYPSPFPPPPSRLLASDKRRTNKLSLVVVSLEFRPQDLNHIMRSLPSTRNLLGGFDDLIDLHGISWLLLFMTPA